MPSRPYPFPIDNEEFVEIRDKIASISRQHYKKDSGIRLEEMRHILSFCIEAIEYGLKSGIGFRKFFTRQENILYNRAESSAKSLKKYSETLGDYTKSVPAPPSELTNLYYDQQVQAMVNTYKLEQRIDEINLKTRNLEKVIEQYQSLEREIKQAQEDVLKDITSLKEQEKEKNRVIETIVFFGSFFTFISLSFQTLTGNLLKNELFGILILNVGTIIIMNCIFFIFSRKFVYEEVPSTMQNLLTFSVLLLVLGSVIYLAPTYL